MPTPTRAPESHGHTLVQAGLGLLLIALVLGLTVPAFPVPRRAVSAHVLGIVQGLLLVLAGLVWPRLAMTPVRSRIAACLLGYGCLAAWLANLAAAAWSAGGTTLPLVEEHGSAAQELVIAIGLRTSAVALIASVGLILWASRTASSPIDRS